MIIRLFADIEVDEEDTPYDVKKNPKDWNWHRFLKLGHEEKIHVYGAAIIQPEVPPTKEAR